MATYYFKPVRRFYDEFDIATSARAAAFGGKRINLCLDLNVAARFNQAGSDQAKLKDLGLLELAAVLANPGIILNPGLAFREMEERLVEKDWRAFNEYLTTFAPEYDDTPDATWDPTGSPMKSFWDLPETAQAVHLPYYISQLLLISWRKTDGTPLRRLEGYLSDMRRYLGQFQPLEARIAQFVFYDRERAHNGDWKAFCGEIRTNFSKPAGSPRTLLKAALNQMLDTYLLRAAQSMHYREKLEADFWIATQDAGLANFAATFCYDEEHLSPSGQFSVFERLVPFPEMETEQYWIEAENLFDAYSTKENWQISDEELESLAKETEVRLLKEMGRTET
ncbi:hypothetical protein [Rhizobium fabae]|uniref:Uncharacterized protein n=1 Tax=Rhizobium fabae TaxID=573179 RepID=A0A7W6B709_9HYPH|nr:hypothetical protein [Rhizobium fabae]MBB3916181.1 hypothetical protein [Rhizobium fabae]